MDNQVVELAYRAPAHLRHSAAPALRLIQQSDAALGAVPTDRGQAWGADRLRSRLYRLCCAVKFKLDYWHKDGLPDAMTHFGPLLRSLSSAGLLGLHKILAYRLSLRSELAPYPAQVIGDKRTRGLPFWKPGALDEIASDHASGLRGRLRDIHAVMTLESRASHADRPRRIPARAQYLWRIREERSYC